MAELTDGSGSRSAYGIGALARRLGVAPATLRDGCRAGYLAAQAYLDPFPAGLGLRSHAPAPSAPSLAKGGSG
jgi:hypothetical protein